MASTELRALPVRLFRVDAGAERGLTIGQLMERVNASGYECWAEFCGTMLKAKPGDTWVAVDDRWLKDRPQEI